jgi:hypothetical protein
MSIPTYRTGTKNRDGRTIFVLEIDVTNLGADLQVILDENERLKGEVKRLNGLAAQQAGELKSLKAGALKTDADDSEQLARLRKVAAAVKKPVTVAPVVAADEPAADELIPASAIFGEGK